MKFDTRSVDITLKSRDIIYSTLSRRLWEGGLIPGMVKIFSLFHSVQDLSRVQLTSYAIVADDLSLGVRRLEREAEH